MSTHEENGHEEIFRVSGEDILKKVKEVIAAGNARRIIIKNEEEKPLLEVVPLTIAVVGAALLPVFAAIGALAAVVTKCVIVVEKR